MNDPFNVHTHGYFSPKRTVTEEYHDKIVADAQRQLVAKDKEIERLKCSLKISQEKHRLSIEHNDRLQAIVNELDAELQTATFIIRGLYSGPHTNISLAKAKKWLAEKDDE